MSVFNKLTFTFIVIQFLILSSCKSSKEELILGKWDVVKDTKTLYTIEFFDNGKTYEHTHKFGNVYHLKGHTLIIGKQQFLITKINLKTMKLKTLDGFESFGPIYNTLKRVK